VARVLQAAAQRDKVFHRVLGRRASGVQRREARRLDQLCKLLQRRRVDRARRARELLRRQELVEPHRKVDGDLLVEGEGAERSAADDGLLKQREVGGTALLCRVDESKSSLLVFGLVQPAASLHGLLIHGCRELRSPTRLEAALSGARRRSR